MSGKKAKIERKITAMENDSDPSQFWLATMILDWKKFQTLMYGDREKHGKSRFCLNLEKGETKEEAIKRYLRTQK